MALSNSSLLFKRLASIADEMTETALLVQSIVLNLMDLESKTVKCKSVIQNPFMPYINRSRIDYPPWKRRVCSK